MKHDLSIRPGNDTSPLSTRGKDANQAETAEIKPIMRAALDIYKCQCAAFSKLPCKVGNGLLIIVFLALGYNGNSLVKSGFSLCLRRKWEGNKFSFSKDLGNSKGSLQPFHSVVIHSCPIVHRVRGNSACARRLFNWQ